MSTKPAKKSQALSRLTPNSLVIKGDDGEDLRIPVNAEENKILGWVMAAKMRALIDAMMKKYKDSDATMTPKELADMATAVSKTEQFAADAYKGPEVPLGKGADDAKPVSGESVDFGGLIQSPQEKPNS